jgi:hypothetical protein
VKGACDDAQVCTNPVIKQACLDQCTATRTDKLGKMDDKSTAILLVVQATEAQIIF